MAAEETEYYSLHAGNGRAPVERADKSRTAAKKKTKKESGKGSRLTPYLQGITVGTVLLIPFGVWCWVRAPLDDTSAAEESTAAHAAPSKSSKQSAANAASKRKPVKIHATAASMPPAKVQAARPTIQGLEPASAPAPGTAAAANDPSPALTAAPAPVPAFKLLPDSSEQEDTSIAITRKPKKGVWKTITSPFRGKGKSSAGDPPPPAGQ